MLPISRVVEVNGLDTDVRVKGVLVEQDSTASVVGNVKVIREARAGGTRSPPGAQSHAISPQCVFQWHLLCLVEVQGSSSGC